MSDVVVPDPVAVPPTRSELVVAALAVPGLDLVSASDLVRARLRRRRSTWLLAAGGLAAVVLVALVVLIVGRGGSDDLDASGDRTTTTVTAPPIDPVGDDAVVPVAPVDTSTTVPVEPAVAPPVEPTSTSPLTGRATVSTAVTVGVPFTLAIDWNDADHAASGDPSVSVEWNDPFLAAAAGEPPASACGATPAPRAGRIERTFRYSTAGRRTISVRLRACTDDPARAEEATFELPVDVRGVSGAALVVAVEGSAGDPDSAAAVRYPADASGPQNLANRSGAVRQVLRRDPGLRATVLVAAGWGPQDVVLLVFPGGSCRWGALGSAAAADAAALVESRCQPVVPTTTTVPVSSTTSTVPPSVPETPGSP